MACPYWNLGLCYGHQNTTVLSEHLTFLSKDVPVPHVFLPDLFCFILSFWTPSSAGDIFLPYEPSLFFVLAKVSSSGEYTRRRSGCAPLPGCLCTSGLSADQLLHQRGGKVFASCCASICFCRLWTMSYTGVFPDCL